jgi:hypothetical protein
MPIRKVHKIIITTTTTFTTLRHTKEIDSDDFEEEDCERLCSGASYGEEIRVVCEATDGYYDIEFADGYKIDAISWYYLDGYTADGEE